jgi:hypothetical protein
MVIEMTDEEAFRELLLSNAQSDLRPLEIGLHVLKAVEPGKGGRGKKAGAADWARQMGLKQPTLAEYGLAAKVFSAWRKNGKPIDQSIHLFGAIARRYISQPLLLF